MLIVRTAAAGDLDAVRRLVQDVYSARGYRVPEPGGDPRPHDALDSAPATAVYLAESPAGSLLGTVSVTTDSPAGLPSDAAFPAETGAERAACAAAGLVLAASWRFVTAPGCRARADVVSALIDAVRDRLAAVHAGRMLAQTHPRHARVWASLLGMAAIAGPRPDPSVCGSPAILMRGDVPAMFGRWRAANSR